MQQENYLIGQFLFLVKKLYLFMYMFLSDRIRRMFLSGACPQNLSPKKPLSLKDNRFLQKTKVSGSSNLTRLLVKQQRLLYEKHIGHLVQENFFKSNFLKKPFIEEKTKSEKPSWEKTPVYLQVSSKVEKTIKTIKKPGKTTFTFSDFRPKTFLGSHAEKAKNHSKQRGSKVEEPALFLPTTENRVNQGKDMFLTLPAKQEFNHYNFNKKSLTLFVQSIKVQKREGPKNLVHQKDEKNRSVFLLLDKGQTALDICKKFATPPLYVNGKSKYINCRYLYDHESLKTCIVPQIFKNQKPVSRAKTLLHERKKIALLYGQLAKKDILALSQKAKVIPGFFEDNMFTLLESRVDVCVFRAGFSKTIAGARQLIRNGSVLVNGTKISSCKRRAKPGDYFTFTFKNSIFNPYKYTTLELYHLSLSSNFLKEKTNKNNLIRELAFKQQFDLKKTKAKYCFKTFSEPLHSDFLVLTVTENNKRPFCHSLYWGFFLYKLYKIPPFSGFFQSYGKTKQIQTNTFKKKNFIGTNALHFSFTSHAKQEKQTMQSFSYDTKSSHLKNVYFKEGKHLKLSCRKKQITENSSTKYATIFFQEKNRQEYNFPQEQGIKGKIEKRNKQKEKAFSNSEKKKNIVILNLYTQLLLKKLQNLKTKTREKGDLRSLFLFRKSIPSNNLWAVWGQKPLHLEISHKTGAFIYMYKPQKIISPVCLDFKI